MDALFWGAGCSFGVVALLGPLAIPLLHRLKFGQVVREDGPAAHKAKTGTPTMGGLLMLAGICIAVLVVHAASPVACFRVRFSPGQTREFDMAQADPPLRRTIKKPQLRQMVPLEYRTDELDDITSWLGALVRSVDSSLLDEWEALRDGRLTLGELTQLESDPEGGQKELAFGADSDGNVAFTRNRHAFRTAVRNSVFRRVEALEREDYDYLDDVAGPALWPGATVWDGDAWIDATEPYFDEYESIGIDTAARGTQFFEVIDKVSEVDVVSAGVPSEQAQELVSSHAAGRLWLVRQTFDDGEGDGSWGFWALVDLDASDRDETVRLNVISVGER